MLKHPSSQIVQKSEAASNINPETEKSQKIFDSLSNDEVINRYITCGKCGWKALSGKQLEAAIQYSSSTRDFLIRCGCYIDEIFICGGIGNKRFGFYRILCTSKDGNRAGATALECVSPKDWGEAVQRLQKEAARFNVAAQYQLGECCLHALGVEHDLAKANRPVL